MPQTTMMFEGVRYIAVTIDGRQAWATQDQIDAHDLHVYNGKKDAEELGLAEKEDTSKQCTHCGNDIPQHFLDKGMTVCSRTCFLQQKANNEAEAARAARTPSAVRRPKRTARRSS